MKNLNLYIIYFLFAALAFGCQKQGYEPPAEGEKEPYSDSIKITLKEGLAQSPATLFYAAWQRSHMDSILKSLTVGKTYFALLVPGNTALESAGYNQQKIQTMPPAELDSLLLFYTLRNRITAEELAGKTDNYIATSLLKHPTLRYAQTLIEADPYSYRHQLQLKGGKTFVNGKPAGAGKYTSTKDGYIWFLDQPIVKPTKTILQFLETDGRFTLLLQILRHTDAQYKQIFRDGAGYELTRSAFSYRYGWELLGTAARPLVITNTLFLPTDNAFKAAGFNTLQDLIDFNRRKGLPVYGIDAFGGRAVLGNFATDTLLNYSVNWGKLFNIDPENSAAKFAGSVPIFYSNVMTNSVLSRYLIVGGQYVQDPTRPDSEYYMPLDFSQDNAENITVKIKGTDAAPAAVIERDIPTLNGPVNAIDHFLIPRGFKIN